MQKIAPSMRTLPLPEMSVSPHTCSCRCGERIVEPEFDDGGLVDEGDNPHFALATRAEERVAFPDFS
ncbi:MAG: hypothetical protein WC765_10085 [Phycisphaerae bacterium]